MASVYFYLDYQHKDESKYRQVSSWSENLDQAKIKGLDQVKSQFAHETRKESIDSDWTFLSWKNRA